MHPVIKYLLYMQEFKYSSIINIIIKFRLCSRFDIKDFLPPRSFTWFYLSKHAIYGCIVEIRISPRELFEGGLFVNMIS